MKGSPKESVISRISFSLLFRISTSLFQSEGIHFADMKENISGIWVLHPMRKSIQAGHYHVVSSKTKSLLLWPEVHFDLSPNSPAGSERESQSLARGVRSNSEVFARKF